MKKILILLLYSVLYNYVFASRFTSEKLEKSDGLGYSESFGYLAKETDSDEDTIKTYSIDEIVVTSSLKETNSLRRLPGSVTILTPQQIAAKQITSIKDISSLAPNLYIPDYGARLTSAIYIRGVGARSSGQSVGLYVDNAPYMDKSAFDFEFADIQRIEVMRGPQGTLYGRNAMGGIINIHTLSPFDYQGVKSSISYGNYGSLNAKVSGYFCAGDKLGLSVGAYFNRNDGFFTNAFDGKRIDNEKNFGGNLKLVGRLSPAFTASYSLSYDNVDQGAFPYGLYDPETNKTAQVNINDESSYTRKILNNNLLLNYSGSSILLTSATSYQFLDDDMRMDQDFSPQSIFVLNQKQKEHVFTEEISLKSLTESNYQWSIGAFGFYNRLATHAPVEFKKDGMTTIFQPIFDNLKAENPSMPTILVTNETLYIPGNFRTPAYGVALYHQSTYNNLFTKGLSVTAGIRLDWEKQSLDYQSEAKMNLAVVTRPGAAPMDITDRYDASVIDEHISQTFREFLPKISLKYECTPRTFTYISAAKGYKTGGYNIQMSADLMQSLMQYEVMSKFAPTLAVEPKPVKEVIAYRPETSWNYETGMRSELIHDRLHVEATLFYMNINDLQITKFVEGGNGRYLSNAGKAVSYGAELTLRTIITDCLTGDLNYGFTHATFRDYNNEREDFKGKSIPYTPQHTFSAAVQYNRLLHSNFIDQLTFAVQYNGAGKIYWTESNNITQPFYGVLNAQAGIRKGIVTLNIWAQNLTATDYAAFYFESFSKHFIQKGKPLQFGTRISVNW